MRFTVLSSGSKGNALVVEGGGTAVMVDAGLRPSVLKERLDQAGLPISAIKALCITHNHYDHAKHAAEVAGSLNIPTLSTEGCNRAQTKSGAPFFAWQRITPVAPFQLGGMTIRCFSTPHDAPGSVGLVFEDETSSVGVVTDLGCVHDELAKPLRGVNLLYIEFNHDVEMLMKGPYPGFLKNRVRSNHGHLSNEQGADLLARSFTPELSHVLLAHLSEQNNTAELAMAAARGVLGASNVTVQIAPQREALGPIQVGVRVGTRQAAPVKPALPEAYVPAPQPVVVRQAPARANSRGGVGLGPGAQLALFGFPQERQ